MLLQSLAGSKYSPWFPFASTYYGQFWRICRFSRELNRAGAKPGLLEVPVKSQGFCKPQFRHERKTRAVGEGKGFVLVPAE